MTKSPNVLLLAACVIAVLVCLGLIAGADLNSRESVLLSLVLTIVSMLGSWLASRFYAEASFHENLRTFALKAAEKVDNLSNELDRLAVYLQEELDETDYKNVAENLLAKELRIEGVIHMLNTLKSVNDRSLSDWRGVIGKELDERREEQQEREEELRNLIERVEELAASNAAQATTATSAFEGAIKGEINSIRSDLRVLATHLGGGPIRRSKWTRHEVEQPCPSCAKPVRYTQQAKPNTVKTMRCDACDSRLLSLMDASGAFKLVVRQPQPETVNCPNCSSQATVDLDPAYGSAVTTPCLSCGAEVRVIRSTKGVTVRVVEPPAAPRIQIDESIIAKVAEKMPPQPWPKGAAKKVADELKLPVRFVTEAVDTLISRGTFQFQHNGKLYAEVNGNETSPDDPTSDGEPGM